MIYYEIGIIVPPTHAQYNGFKRTGMLLGMNMKHHAFIYGLHLDNPALPLYV